MRDDAWLERFDIDERSNQFVVRSVGVSGEEVIDALAAGATFDELQQRWPGLEPADIEAIRTCMEREPVFVGSFEQWLDLVFSPQPTKFPKDGDLEAEHATVLPDRELLYFTRMLREGGTCLAPYSDSQVEQVMWEHYVGGSLNSRHDKTGTIKARQIECIEAMPTFFEQVYAARCTPTLSHREAGANPLNGSCYMWWDSLNIGALHDSFGDALWPVLERQLAIPHVAVQESALHGLGHLGYQQEAEVARIIDRYLRRAGAALRPELREYAELARQGYVQ